MVTSPADPADTVKAQQQVSGVNHARGYSSSTIAAFQQVRTIAAGPHAALVATLLQSHKDYTSSQHQLAVTDSQLDSVLMQVTLHVVC